MPRPVAAPPAPSTTRAPAVVAVLATPVGPLHAAATDEGIVGLELRTTDEAFAASVGARTRRAAACPAADPAASPAARAHLAELEREIGEHLAGTRDAFDLPVVLEGMSDWDHRVLKGVCTIPRGATASYGEVARRIGKPGAARAVGGAVGRNPIGLLDPLPPRDRRRRDARRLRRQLVRQSRGAARAEGAPPGARRRRTAASLAVRR